MSKSKKQPVDPAEEGFRSVIWKQWQAWRKHLADNERRGRPDVTEGAPPIMDENARGAFADWLADRGDPREHVVRQHPEANSVTLRMGRAVTFPSHPMHDKPLGPGELFAAHPEPSRQYSTLSPFINKDTAPDWDFHGDLIHPGRVEHRDGDYNLLGPVLPSVVWRHAGVTTSRKAGGSSRFSEHPVMFHAPVTVEQYMQIADKQPEAKRKEWHAYAEHHGWIPKIGGPARLARQATQTGLGGSVGQEQSDNHQKRLDLARQVLKEAGLRGKVLRVLAHAGGASRPAVGAVLAHTSNDQHALYAAAWLGLMTQQPSVTLFHPGKGDDVLHVVDSPHPVAHVADYLNRSGVQNFSTEANGVGTKVYMVNPAADPQLITRGLDGSNSSYRGRAERIGAGSGARTDGAAGTTTADAAAARSGYRTVIHDAERAAGLPG